VYRTGWLAGDLSVAGIIVDGTSHRRDDGTTKSPASNRVGRPASSMAARVPSDIGVAEVHDSLTLIELIGYEDHGFAEPAAVSAVTILEGPVTDGR
jgi:acetyl-CoA C-acetyltransferase